MKSRWTMMMLAIVLGGAAAQASATDWACLPTCSETDGRFLMIAGQGFNSLAGSQLEFWIAVPAGTQNWTLSIFDGDTGGMWDLGSHGPNAFQYTLYADPNGDGTGNVQVGQWYNDQMTDNGWYDIALPVNNQAQQGPNGAYHYKLVVEDTDPYTWALSCFKVRVSGYAAVAPREFAFIARLGGLPEALVIYPNLDPSQPLDPEHQDLATTTYDGTFDFYFDVPSSRLSRLDIWDGDFDFGAFAG